MIDFGIPDGFSINEGIKFFFECVGLIVLAICFLYREKLTEIVKKEIEYWKLEFGAFSLEEIIISLYMLAISFIFFLTINLSLGVAIIAGIVLTGLILKICNIIF